MFGIKLKQDAKSDENKLTQSGSRKKSNNGNQIWAVLSCVVCLFKIILLFWLGPYIIENIGVLIFMAILTLGNIVIILVNLFLNSSKARQSNTQDSMTKSNVSWISTLLLCVFLCWQGTHRFYVGNNRIGFLYLISYGCFGIGFLIDFILIVFNKFKDQKGKIVYGHADDYSANNVILYYFKSKLFGGILVLLLFLGISVHTSIFMIPFVS